MIGTGLQMWGDRASKEIFWSNCEPPPSNPIKTPPINTVHNFWTSFLTMNELKLSSTPLKRGDQGLFNDVLLNTGCGMGRNGTASELGSLNGTAFELGSF